MTPSLRTLCLALVALLALGGTARSAGPVTVESVHYALASEGPEEEAREFTRVLEAAWPQFEAFFGAAPKLAKGERLAVRFFETEPAMNAAITAAGGQRQDAGGYYCPVARTAYAFRQPTRWYTRTLVIHEAAHQFHLLGVASKASPPPPGWWVEGIAEHVSHHTWDGTTLRLGVVPPISQEDRWGAAARAFGSEMRPETIPEDASLDRAKVMHLVRFFATADGGKPLPSWKELAKGLDRGAVPKTRELWKGFKDVGAFRDRFTRWFPSAMQPFLVEFVEWDSLAADVLRATAPVVSICRTRNPATAIEASIEPVPGAERWRVGLLLAWTGPKDYLIGQIDSGTTLRVDRLVAGEWKTVHTAPVADAMRPAAGTTAWKFSGERRGSEVLFTIGGGEPLPIESPQGPLGLCLDATTATFRDVRMR